MTLPTAPAPAAYVFVHAINQTWHDTYSIDADAALTDAQRAVVERVIGDDFDGAVCARGEACPTREGGALIGYILRGDRDEYVDFHPFAVSDTDAVCEECMP
jgi:hypothetical protein